MGFKNWEAKCDRIMLEKYGVGVDDIPDMPWHTWFDLDELEPHEAVELAIEKVNEGGF